jgi:hypothetical protein
MEVHSSRLKQAGDRISELKDKVEIKGQTEEQLVKQVTGYNSRSVKGICKDSPTPSKDQT